MRGVLFSVTALASALGLIRYGWAADCADNLVACLVYGGPQEEVAPRKWEFDPDSGFTLGAATALDCLRGNLVFHPSGHLTLGDGQAAPEGCETGDPANNTFWEETVDSRTGEIGISIRRGADTCHFSVSVDPDHPETLLLTTPCHQQPGHPVQFRYFLGDPS